MCSSIYIMWSVLLTGITGLAFFVKFFNFPKITAYMLSFALIASGFFPLSKSTPYKEELMNCGGNDILTYGPIVLFIVVVIQIYYFFKRKK